LSPLSSSSRIFSALWISGLALSLLGGRSAPQIERSYLGFDRNEYPGDEAMKTLRRDFVFTGYWLGPPPGENVNSWKGKREYLRSLDYGFLLLANGRNSRELKSVDDAVAKGVADATAASESARKDGFPAGAIIFVDIEEGGRLIAPYHAYLKAWGEQLRSVGYRPGTYCSGMPVSEGGGIIITTAADIHLDRQLSEFVIWIYDDACPPSNGCAASQPPLPSHDISYAAVWQFAQSPRRKQYTAKCAAKYAPDGNCYAPSDTARKWFLDLNAARSQDPSEGAR
jgi:hypothetical protein